MPQTLGRPATRSFRLALLTLLLAMLIPVGAQAALPDLTARPTVSGLGEVGVDLRATAPPNAGGEGVLTWTWERSGLGPIPGATSYHYTLQPEDAGRTVSAVATVTNADGSDFERSLTIMVQEVRPGGGKVATFRQGPRFNLEEKSGPEISDVTEDGRTLVSTEGDVVDITNLKEGIFKAPLPDTGLGGIVSVSLHKDDKWVLLAQQTPGQTTDTVWVIELATHQLVRGIQVPEGIDSVNVSPDGNYALAVLEAEDEEALGQVAVIETKAADPEAWEVTPIAVSDGVPGDAGLLTDDPQPEFAAIRADNTAAVTIQEDNAVAIIDLPTATVTDLWSMGSIDRLADLTNDGDIVFDDPYNPASVADPDPRGGLGAEREPDAIAWIDGGTKLAIAEEGEYNVNGGRGWSIWKADGDLVWETEGSLDELMARHNLATDGRATSRGNEYEGLTAATFDGREYVFVGSERAFGLAAYDVTNPASPRFVTAIPTGREPEGMVASEAREIVITSNENGNADSWTVMEGIPVEAIDPDRRPVVGGPGAYRLSLGKLGVAGASRFVATLDNFRIGLLETAARDRVRLTRINVTQGGAPLGSGEFTDVAVDPDGGWWVLQSSQLRHVEPDGAIGPNLAPGAGTQVGIAVAADGSAVYLVNSSRQVRVYDVAATTLSAAISLPQPTGLPAGVSSFSVVDVDRTGDGRLFLSGNTPAVLAVSAFPVVGEPAPQPVVVRSGIVRAARGVAGVRNGIGVLPNGDVWATAAEVEGSNQRSTHLQRFQDVVEEAPAPPPPAPGKRLPGLSPSPMDAGPSGEISALAEFGDEIVAAGKIRTWGANAGAASVEFGPDGLATKALPGNPNAPILAAATDAEGRIYVGGEFTSLITPSGEGVPRQHLARILPDGTLDPSFAPAVDGNVRAIEVSGDRVVVGGDFMTVNGAAQPRLAVLNAGDGSSAATTLPAIGTEPFGESVQAIELAPDGDLIVAGEFATAGGSPVNRIVRIDTANPAAYALDPAFSAGSSEAAGGGTEVYDMVVAGGSIWALRGSKYIQRLNLASGADNPSVEYPALEDSFWFGGKLASDGTRVYATWRRSNGTGTGQPVFAFDATSGEQVDSFKPTQADIGDAFERGALGLVDGVLMVGGIDGVAAIDPLTGAARPDHALSVFGVPYALLALPGDKLFVAGLVSVVGEAATHLLKFDPQTGERDRSFVPELPEIGSNGFNAKVAKMSVDGRRAAVLMTNASGAERLGVVDLVNGSGFSGLEEAISGEAGTYEIQLVGDYLYVARESQLVVIDLRTLRQVPERRLDGVEVRSFLRVPGTDDILVAGNFTAIDGFQRPGLARIDTASGDVVTSFDPPQGGTALALSADGEKVYVGGNFSSFGAVKTAGVARIDLDSGAPDPGFVADLSYASSEVEIYKLNLVHGRLLVNGSFDRVDGLERGPLVALETGSGRLVPTWVPPTNSVDAVAGTGSNLFVGGYFEGWGGARYLARFVLTAPVNVTAPTVVAPAGGPGDGAELVCDPGAWDGDPDLSYRWLLAGQPIAGATGSRFTPAKSQVGGVISCDVSGANELGSAGPVASAEVTIVAGPPRSTAVPTITGQPVVGATLTAGSGQWDRPTDSVAYLWLRNGVATAVTTNAYVVPAGAGGDAITVRLLATDAAGESEPVFSDPVTIAIAPENTAPPEISGGGQVGVALTASTGTWSGSPSFAFEWRRDGAPISGATGSTYTPVDADEGKTLTVRVTGTTAAGSATATSAGVSVSLPAAPTVIQPPVISGPGLVGSQLTCNSGQYAGKGPLTIELRWLRGGATIATSATYTLTAEDLGREISCAQQVTNKGGSILAQSTPVVPVQPVPEQPVVEPTAPTPAATAAALEPPALGKRGRAARIEVVADAVLTDVRLRLSRDGRVFASRRFASLQPGATVSLRIGKKLARGTYMLILTARDPQGRVVRTTEELAIR